MNTLYTPTFYVKISFGNYRIIMLFREHPIYTYILCKNLFWQFNSSEKKIDFRLIHNPFYYNNVYLYGKKMYNILSAPLKSNFFPHSRYAPAQLSKRGKAGVRRRGRIGEEKVKASKPVGRV